MEPMALGSAPSSPSSPATNPNYLPAFLLGDAQPSPPNSPLTPEVHKSVSFASDKNTFRQKLFTPSASEATRTPTQTKTNDTPGPPKQSLFDTLEIKRPTNINLSISKNVSTPQQDSFTRSFNESTNENFESVRYGATLNTWVTVFGFPSTAASLVLARFANCGTITDKQFPAQGNWVHLKYSNSLEASKALALNGALISNLVMVGVSVYQSATNKENANPAIANKTPTRARSLRLSYVSPQNPNTVITPESVPQKSTNMFSKTLDYVFGW